MRLGAYFWTASSLEDLDRLCETWDELGLSAIPAPMGYWNWPDEQCKRFGEQASALDLVIGEAGFGENLLDPDKMTVACRIETIRRMLVKGEIMGVRGVVTLVGSRDAAAGVLSPHPYNFSTEARRNTETFACESSTACLLLARAIAPSLGATVSTTPLMTYLLFSNRLATRAWGFI